MFRRQLTTRKVRQASFHYVSDRTGRARRYLNQILCNNKLNDDSCTVIRFSEALHKRKHNTLSPAILEYCLQESVTGTVRSVTFAQEHRSEWLRNYPTAPRLSIVHLWWMAKCLISRLLCSLMSSSRTAKRWQMLARVLDDHIFIIMKNIKTVNIF